MSIDELIAVLQEAKEHGIQGKRSPIVVDDYTGDGFTISDVIYDNKNVTIKIN